MARVRFDKVYVLNPYYHLRHDLHRVVMFARGGTNDICSCDWQTFIHPLQAALLSFFTYERTLREVLPLLCDFFCKEQTQMLKWVAEFINNPQPIHTPTRKGDIHFPKKVLIEAEKAGERLHFDQIEANSFIWQKTDLTSRRLYTGPLQLTLMLTNRCVTRCRYCYADTQTAVKHPLSTARIMELIEEAARMKVKQVNLMGGEVFLHPDWDKILARLVELDIAPEFLSTKIPVTESIIQRLLASNYQGCMQVSLDACDPQILKSSIGTNETYMTEVLKGLRLLDASGLKYQVSTVLTTYNCHFEAMKQLYLMLIQLKQPDSWRIVPVSNSITKEYRKFALLKPGKKEIESLFEQLHDLTKESHFPIFSGKDILQKSYRNTDGGSKCFNGNECSALTTHLFILPDGKATICEQLYWNPHFIIGDAARHTLLDIWNSPRALHLYHLSKEDIRTESPCHDCKLFDTCFGHQNRCWSDVIKAYGKENYDYPDPRCIYAPPLINELSY